MLTFAIYSPFFFLNNLKYSSSIYHVFLFARFCYIFIHYADLNKTLKVASLARRTLVGKGNGGGGSLSPLRPAESNMDPRPMPSSWTQTTVVKTRMFPLASVTCQGGKTLDLLCHPLPRLEITNVSQRWTKTVWLLFEPCATTRIIIGILRWFSNSKGLAVPVTWDNAHINYMQVIHQNTVIISSLLQTLKLKHPCLCANDRMGCSSSQTSAMDPNRPGAKPEESNGASTTGRLRLLFHQ